MPLIRNTAVASGKNEGNSVGSKELSLVTVAVLTPPWSRLPGIATSGRGQLCETDMARARNIKPAFFDNDRLGETEPLARLMFIGMWTIADFNGNLVWREKRIKAKLLPYDDCDVVKLAINLEKSGVIRFYSNGDDVFCNIKGFSKHQNPHKNEREAGTEIPEFTENMAQLVDLSTLAINRDKSGTSLEQYGTDRASSLIPLPDSLNLIPEENPPPSSDGYERDKDDPKRGEMILKSGEMFPVYDSDITKLEQTYQTIDVVYQLKMMKAWLESNPNKRKTKTGMPKFINSWLNRAVNNG